MTRASRNLIVLLVSATCAVLGLFGARNVSAQVPAVQGVIEGRAVLASAGSSAPLDTLPASLFTFINGVRQVPPAASQTDSQGRVRFAELNTGPGFTYTLFIKFQDTIYRSDAIGFPEGAATVSATVNVYDSATESSGLSISQHHLIVDIDSESRALSVIEFYVIANSSDRTVTGAADVAASGKNVSFRAQLPPGAVVDSVDGHQLGDDVYQASNMLMDTAAIPPGESSLVFSYRLPIDRSTQVLSIASPFTTTALNVLVAPGIALRAPRLLAQGTVPAGNRVFQHYAARDLAAGSSIAVELSGLPAPLIPIDILQWLPLAGVSLALGVTLIVVLRGKKDNAPPPRQTSA
jgi:hypothetical protein